MRKILTLLFASLLFVNCDAKDKLEEKDNDMITAVKNNKIEEVKSLIKEGHDVEAKDSQNRSLLMIATYANNVAMAKILVDAGANVNAQDNMKNSPFLYAGAEGMLELVNLYLGNGADFKVFNRYGGSALIPAAEKGHLEVVKILAYHKGFPIDHVNNLGWTALMEAVVLGTGGKVHTDIVRVLVEAGCDVNIPDSQGVSALTHAKKRGFVEIAKILEEASK